MKYEVGNYVRLNSRARGYIHYDSSKYNAIFGAPLDKRYENFPNYMDYKYKVIKTLREIYNMYYITSEEGCHIVIDEDGLKKLSILEMVLK